MPWKFTWHKGIGDTFIQERVLNLGINTESLRHLSQTCSHAPPYPKEVMEALTQSGVATKKGSSVPTPCLRLLFHK